MYLTNSNNYSSGRFIKFGKTKTLVEDYTNQTELVLNAEN